MSPDIKAVRQNLVLIVDNGQLNPQMQGSGYEYLYGTQRDFFYLTNFAPPVTKSTKSVVIR